MYTELIQLEQTLTLQMVIDQCSFDSDGLAGINNYILERPNLVSITVIYVDDQHVKGCEPKSGEAEINWDFIYQEYIKWTGHSLCTKDM